MKVLQSVAVLFVLVAMAIPAAAAPNHGATMLAKMCYRQVRRCYNNPIRVCQSQRYCQPRQQCYRTNIGNRIVNQCRRVCQWLTRQVCRYVNRVRCRIETQRYIAAVCGVRG